MDETRLSRIEARMKSGEPFTYGMLCAVAGGDDDRLVDKTIQRWRRKGWVGMEGRVGRAPRWVLVEGAEHNQ